MVGIDRWAFQVYLGTRIGCITTRQKRAPRSFLNTPGSAFLSAHLFSASTYFQEGLSLLPPLASFPRPRPKAVFVMERASPLLITEVTLRCHFWCVALWPPIKPELLNSKFSIFVMTSANISMLCPSQVTRMQKWEKEKKLKVK